MRWLLLLAVGCGGAVSPDDMMPQAGFGQPALEVTINGAHAGPSAPDSTSGVTLDDVRDSFGRVTQSSLRLVASSAATGASCSLAIDRFGDDVAPFGAGQYQLSGGSGTSTPPGTAATVSPPTAATVLGSVACNGDECATVGVNFSHLDADYVEGFFSGTLGGADVVCSFYLPTLRFQP
jgi:hypothetical protein